MNKKYTKKTKYKKQRKTSEKKKQKKGICNEFRSAGIINYNQLTLGSANERNIGIAKKTATL